MPPPWDDIYLARPDISRWVEGKRLPWEDFPFDNPIRLPKEDLVALAIHIVQGEMDEVEEERRFMWKGQGTSRVNGTALVKGNKRSVETHPLLQQITYTILFIGRKQIGPALES